MNNKRLATLTLLLCLLFGLAACDLVSQSPSRTNAAESVAQTANAPETATDMATARAVASPTIAPNTVQILAPTRVPLPTVLIPTPLALNATPTRVAPTRTPFVSPTAPRRAATPRSIVERIAALRNQILFFTDREGGLYPKLYVMNADGANPRACDCSDLLVELARRQVTAPDGHAFVYVRGPEDEPVFRQTDTQIWIHDNASNTDSLLIGGPPAFGWLDYDPVWSPRGDEIAWVTQINKVDEIYALDLPTRKSQRLTRSAWEWYKHPTYAPDGSQLAFMSNRVTGRQQIWVMARDGDAMRNLSNNAYNDSSPLWVK
ncbi:MAG: PD40 domain-containing protein [Chloroflexi bacterium]|nr:PD40 domain-containing protein [Chloroflexota bacterium]